MNREPLWKRNPDWGRAHVYKKKSTWFAEWRDHQGQIVAAATFTHGAALRIANEQTTKGNRP